eukprot:1319729-Prymnesium_polylepis.1
MAAGRVARGRIAAGCTAAAQRVEGDRHAQDVEPSAETPRGCLRERIGALLRYNRGLGVAIIELVAYTSIWERKWEAAPRTGSQ